MQKRPCNALSWCSGDGGSHIRARSVNRGNASPGYPARLQHLWIAVLIRNVIERGITRVAYSAYPVPDALRE